MYKNLPIDKRHNLEIRIYNAIPVITLHCFNDTAYIGSFWYGKSSISGPQIKAIIKDNSYFGSSVSGHFYEIWQNSPIFNLDDM